MKKMKSGYKLIILSALLMLYACSTQKNTTTTRTYHNVTAHFNVYFNGNESYKAGINKIEKNYKDNYSILLPVHKYTNEEAAQTAQSDMNRTLEKMGKTIAVHSITVKPKIKGKMTPRDKVMMKKNEYCKWIDEAYLLIGKANYHNGEYFKSLRSFRKIMNDFKTEDTRFEAQLWTSKVYIAQNKFQDALNYLTQLEADVRHPKKLDKEICLTFAEYYQKQQDYSSALTKLEEGIKLTKKKKEKARYYYLMAQMYQELGNDAEAAKNYKKVIKLNPNYDMVFSAKIKRATAFTIDQDSKEIKKELRKMIKDEKNEEYRDQIYYALATIEQKEGNEEKAIEYFKLSAQTSVSNNNQKALSFLALANIYFEKKDFLPAGKYYDSTMQYLSQDYPNYKTISRKAQNTGFLVEYLTVVEEQDSLQAIAQMPEAERVKLINGLIQDAIEEERIREEEMSNTPVYDPTDFGNQTLGRDNAGQGGKWYMYNPVIISRGKNEFIKKWGKRKLEDNWRRKNKSVVNDFGEETTPEGEDSTKVTDAKRPEYYLQNLPLTDSLMEISNDMIASALFNAADVYEKLLLDYEAAIKTYKDLLERYPETDFKLETYYRLYKLNQKLNKSTKEELYRNKIINEYPKSKYAKMLQDPDFFKKLMATESDALALFDQILRKYNSGNYQQTIEFANYGIKKYPNSQAYPNYLFFKAKAYGRTNQQDSMIHYLNIVKKNYPKTEIGGLAADVLALIKSGKYNYDIYKTNPNEQYLFMALVANNVNFKEFDFNLKISAEQFTADKTFKINKVDFDNTQQLITIQIFDNQIEATDFYKYIIKTDAFKNLQANQYKAYFISNSNFELFKSDKIIDKYNIFFRNNFLPLE